MTTRQQPEQPVWVIMPVLAAPAMTEGAIADVLAQSVPVRLLVVNQGVDDPFRDHLERLAEQEPTRLMVWSHMPPLPSLSATWNRGLDAAWAAGASEALVVNNDVKLSAMTVEILRECLRRADALFVSAVGVTLEDFAKVNEQRAPYYDGLLQQKGGPDFSCFLISAACHARFRFDEGFIPAHCEDLDYHRRLMLACEGQRIFSINLPYLHFAAQTLKQVDAATRQRIERETQTIARAYYARKWGGGVNEERWLLPFRPDRADSRAATPELQRLVQTGEALPFLSPNEREFLGQQGNYQPRGRSDGQREDARRTEPVGRPADPDPGDVDDASDLF